MHELVKKAKERRKAILNGDNDTERSKPYTFVQEETGQLITRRFSDLYRNLKKKQEGRTTTKR